MDRGDYFPGIWDTNVMGDTLYGVPWYVDTRLLFYRRDLLAQAGFTHRQTSWPEWSRMLAAFKANAAPDRYAILLPLNEFGPLLVLALQQRALRSCATDGRYGNFESPDSGARSRSTSRLFRGGWAPPLTNAEVSNVWNEFGRGYFSFYISGPWDIGEFKRRLPADKQARLDDRTAAADRPAPGASVAGGSSLAIFARRATRAPRGS